MVSNLPKKSTVWSITGGLAAIVVAGLLVKRYRVSGATQYFRTGLVNKQVHVQDAAQKVNSAEFGGNRTTPDGTPGC
uniref:Uncharacterized protein n=1 Tax=Marseillevirus LCMAC202 TaxID=2506606 RepID=A0A481YX60_9VIRU|nr:MAG: hypothetical protein LCMAC202_01480 [Marseillevirus LCMAC202]